MPSLSVVRFSPVACERNSAFAAWRLIPAQWMTSNSYSDNLRRQRPSLPKLSVKLSVRFRYSCYVFIVNPILSRYGRNIRSTLPIERHSLCGVSYRRSALVYYPTGITLRSGRFCRRTQQPVCHRRLRQLWDERLNWERREPVTINAHFWRF